MTEMANNTSKSVKGALKTAAKSAPAAKDNSLKAMVNKMEGEIVKALPSTIKADRFIRTVGTALSSNPKLAECTQQSFLGAMMTSAQLGLEVNTPLGQAYLIPYRNKGKMECQFQLGYRGLLDLAYRSGRISSVSATTVYEKDEFSYCLGLNPDIHHVPYLGSDRGNITHFYAVYHTKDGGYGFDVMGVEEMKEHAKRYSKSYNSASSPWKTNFEQMAKKTCLKRCLKYAPMSAELARNINADETIKSLPTSQSLREDMDVMDMENEVDYTVEDEFDDDYVPFEEDVSADLQDGQQSII